MMELAVGQTWVAKDVSSALLRIGRIEPFGESIAVHVSLQCDTPAALVQKIGARLLIDHLPFDQQALRASLDQRSPVEFPATAHFEEGYAQWRKDNGGLFTTSVAQAIAYVSDVAFGTPR